MKEVLILEGEQKVREALARLVQKVDREARIFVADDVDMAYGIAASHSVDLFLIGISLDPGRPEDRSGVEFAKRIRELRRYVFTPMVFTTDVYDPCMNLQNTVQCFSVIQKPYRPRAVKETIKEALKFQTEDIQDRKVIFHADGMLEAVAVRDIIYAYAKQYCLYVRTTHGELALPNKTCRYLQQGLNSSSFLQCGRSTIVNVKYIRKIDAGKNSICLRNCDAVLKIGPRYKKEIVKLWKKNY